VGAAEAGIPEHLCYNAFLCRSEESLQETLSTLS
jgi:hypothetical protein